MLKKNNKGLYVFGENTKHRNGLELDPAVYRNWQVEQRKNLLNIIRQNVSQKFADAQEQYYQNTLMKLKK